MHLRNQNERQVNDYDSDLTGTYDRELDEFIASKRQTVFNLRRNARLRAIGKCVRCQADVAECVCGKHRPKPEDEK